MPRRPPKKPDPALDLDAHLLAWESLSAPLDPATLFPRAAPVELEVGSGKGLFLAAASTAQPDRNFLGIEIAHGYARLCAGKLARSHAMNARIVHGDATFIVRSVLDDARLAGVHVYFPDPWWKARHRKRRVLAPEFLRQAGRVLERGGRLHVWTDVGDYFTEAMAAAAATGLFHEPREEPARPAEHDLDYRTHFERRTRLAGEPVWRAVLERNDVPPNAIRVPVATGTPAAAPDGDRDPFSGP